MLRHNLHNLTSPPTHLQLQSSPSLYHSIVSFIISYIISYATHMTMVLGPSGSSILAITLSFVNMATLVSKLINCPQAYLAETQESHVPSLFQRYVCSIYGFRKPSSFVAHLPSHSMSFHLSNSSS